MKRVLIFLTVLLVITSVFAAQDISWVDYGSNPVNVNSPGARAYMPTALYNASWGTASAYKIWYDSASYAGLGFSVSSDGINWSTVSCTGVNASCGRPTVIYNSSWTHPYRLYYTSDASVDTKIRVAESDDGFTFVNDQVAYDSNNVPWVDGHPVLYDATATPAFKMYANIGGGFSVLTSSDGYSFQTTASLAVAGTADLPSSVLKISATDYRLFGYSSNTAITYYVSSDGLSFTVKQSPVSTVGSLGATGTWNANRNYFCSVVYLGGGQFKMFRSGYNNSVYRIGLATGTDASSVDGWLHY